MQDTMDSLQVIQHSLTRIWHEEARKEAYSEFEKAYAEAPGILLVAYLQGDYVGVSGLDGLDTTRVLGHHSVGVMWNIEDWTITK